MIRTLFARAGFAWAGLLLVLGCSRGTGSDIGPNLDVLPAGDYRVLVRNDAGKPVVGATIRVAGVGPTAATGSLGRGILRAVFSGRRLLSVEGDNAAAQNGDQLGVIAVAADTPDGNELPYTIYLPDVFASQVQNLAAGVQPATVVLDDTAQSGAVLTVSAGDTVTFGAAISEDLKLAKLAVEHLPIGVPATTGTAALTSRAIWVHPLGAQFLPGAQLAIPNTELNLPAAASANLYYLEPTTGDWVLVGTGTENAGQIEAPVGSVTKGGLYCFAVDVAATTTVSGRVLDAAGFPLPGVLVRGPQASTRSNGAGVFLLPAMAGFDAGGVARNVNIELDGGRSLLPVQSLLPLALSPITLDMGDVTLDSRRVTNLRVLMVSRGFAVPYQRLRVSSSVGLTGDVGTSDANAQVFFEDLADGDLGAVSTVPRNGDTVLRTQFISRLNNGFADNSLRSFAQETFWALNIDGGTRIESRDQYGTGHLSGAYVIVGTVGGAGLVGQTDIFGGLQVGVPQSDDVTCVMQSTAGSSTVTSAVSFNSSLTGLLEMPIERPLQSKVGSFARFGMYQGDITNSLGVGRVRRVSSSGGMTLQDWMDETVLALPSTAATPVQLDPAVTGGSSYVRGVPAGAGQLVAIEGTDLAGVFTLERMAVTNGLSVLEGSRQVQDLDLAHIVGSSFSVTGGLLNQDALITDADLSFDLAGELANGLVVDLARMVSGNITPAGDDVSVSLPTLPPGLTRYWLALGGSTSSAGAAVEQRSIVSFVDAANQGAGFLPLPLLSGITSGDAVPATGFSFGLTLPAQASYAIVQLRSDTGSDVKDWTAVLPWDATGYSFREFQAGVPAVLEAGRSWTLKVTCVRASSPLLLGAVPSQFSTYQKILTHWVGLKEADRGVDALSSVSISLTSI